GRGNWWHTFVMSAKKGRERWVVKFIPWYTTGAKYRRMPQPDWRPSEVALQHATKVQETSHEYVGHSVSLTREQLYWWETVRSQYASKGELAFFLTNYGGTLEESFQHSGKSVFSPELLDHYRLQTGVPQLSTELMGMGQGRGVVE